MPDMCPACQAKFDAHVKAVQQFLADMYATMIDPLAGPGDPDVPKNVTEMCEVLLEAARKQRDDAYERMEARGSLDDN